MDAELKTILTVLLDKVERIDSTLPTLATKADIVRLEERLDRVEEEQREMKVDLREVRDEQRQMKEMLGAIRMREIGRLDGRIDQLAMDVALGRKPAAE